jgi:hypothetical protein
MLKYYISGAMTGVHDLNRPLFNQVAEIYKLKGVVLNPAILPDGLTHKEYMRIDIAMLSCCDVIVMIAGWEYSEGAIEEYNYAILHGIKVEYWYQFQEEVDKDFIY